MSTRAHVGVLLLSLAAAFACDRAEPERGRSIPATSEAAAAGPASSAELPLPPEGRVEVSIGADGILALANRAPRRRVLEALARETDLVVVAFVEGGDPEGRVTIRSRGEPIEVVLARALVGVPFSVGPLEPGARDRLTVVVGWRDAAMRAGPAPLAARPAPAPRAPSERATRTQEEGAAAQLTSRDPSERAEAVEFTDVTSVAGFEAVVERLVNDPDASVRAAAAETLGEGDVGSVRPLLDALSDPDSSVVLAALESLELLGDASILPEIGPALEHPDAAVRERAAELGEFLE
jgi:hypothetical protein